MQEVGSSRLLSSTQFLPALLTAWRCIGFTLGGVVAGEGSFTIAHKRPPFADGSPRLRFVIQVSMAERDRPLLEALKTFLGFGSIYTAPPRQTDWLPMSVFTIASLRAHHAATIPFASTFLLPCEKRSQFLTWRDALVTYERALPAASRPGRSICSVPGCEEFVRGRMLCRRHYYRATGY
jgi:hypothetical protein